MSHDSGGDPAGPNSTVGHASAAKRSPYARPTLRLYGDVSALTAGGSTGGKEDMANQMNKKP